MPIPEKIAIAKDKYRTLLKELQDYAASGSKEAGFEQKLIVMLTKMIELRTEAEILGRVMQHQAQRAMPDLNPAAAFIASKEGKEELLYSCPDNPYESIYIRAKIKDGLLTVTDSECGGPPDGGWSQRVISFDADNSKKAVALLLEKNRDPFRALAAMLSYSERTRGFLKECDTSGIAYKNQLFL